MISVVVDDKELNEKFRECIVRMKEMNPLLRAIGGIMTTSIERNFAQEGRYGEPGSWEGGSQHWDALAPATIKQRMNTGHWPGKKLQVSGSLAASIHAEFGNDWVVIGTNKKYAAIHQFGGQAGRGLKTTIPARPYLVVQNDDLKKMLEAVLVFLH